MDIDIPLPKNKGFIVETRSKYGSKIHDRSSYQTFDEAFENKTKWFNNQNKLKYARVNIYIILLDNSEKLYLGEFNLNKTGS